MYPVLCIVLPCFNEEEVLETTIDRMSKLLDQMIKNHLIDKKSYLIFVDDGSVDSTWSIISNSKDSKVRGVKLSKNYGHQNALLAGLLHENNISDCMISIDADLQQDENCIPSFIEKFNEGNDIVYGVRHNRTSDKMFKRITANGFYGLMNWMGVSIIPNHADFRLISRKVVDSLKQYKEYNLFLRGLFPAMGYSSAIVYHDVKERFAGESKYTLRKMLSFAVNGITSFSIKPIRLISALGLILFSLSIIMTIYVLYVSSVNGVVKGWASTVLPIYFLGGVQLLSIGLVGEYIGKIYLEVKGRPQYNIDEVKAVKVDV